MALTRRDTMLLLAASFATGALADAAKDGRLSARPAAPTLPAPEPGAFISLRGGAVLYIPKTFTATSATPLLVMLHGSGGDALSTAKDLSASADARGILLLAPKSRNATWDLRHMPDCEDAGIVDDALAQAFAHAHVGRVALAGVSDGASFALSLGLANGDLFSDVIAFSAGFFHVGATVGHPRIFISHGRHDRVLSFSLGERIASSLTDNYYDVMFRPFDGGHEIPLDGLNAALDRFLQ